jgi:hypothetical protein
MQSFLSHETSLERILSVFFEAGDLRLFLEKVHICMYPRLHIDAT